MKYIWRLGLKEFVLEGYKTMNIQIIQSDNRGNQENKQGGTRMVDQHTRTH